MRDSWEKRDALPSHGGLRLGKWREGLVEISCIVVWRETWSFWSAIIHHMAKNSTGIVILI